MFQNNRHVGRLEMLPNGATSFEYDRAWLDRENAFPISLSLPLQHRKFTGRTVRAVFENLLPDNERILTRIAERVGAGGLDPYHLLSRIGRDCVGALQFLPDGEDPGPLRPPQGEAVSEEDVARMIRDLALRPLGMGPDEQFRISVAGAQEKTSLLKMDGKWYRPLGASPTTHILKPPIGRWDNGIDLSHSVENEHFCLTVLGKLGLPVAKTEIQFFEDQKVLSVERFDRKYRGDGTLMRLPQEDCCQALETPPTNKYQVDGGPGVPEIMELLKGGDEPEGDRAAFFRAILLFWLMGATDGHAKNFSIFLMPGGRYHLTPLYDVISVQPTFDRGEIERRHFRMAMRYGENNHYRMDEIVGRHLIQTGESAGLGRLAASILEEVKDRFAGAVDAAMNEMPKGFPEEIHRSIRRGALVRLQTA
ncbi:type II toxin-antitoxin system HipA family toxin [Aestuariispira insulae]|uniref:type II toxin-antitoxin system HipA family toxin n=1 Tax=Aestuariispira insulae TaxID=1461337 RepID=UPI001FE56D97|nr:type II toxin-antitoxin system HipA family toxin [Aestuariispira insulae]